MSIGDVILICIVLFALYLVVSKKEEEEDTPPEPKRLCNVTQYSGGDVVNQWLKAEYIFGQFAYVRIKDDTGSEIIVTGTFVLEYL